MDNRHFNAYKDSPKFLPISNDKKIDCRVKKPHKSILFIKGKIDEKKLTPTGFREGGGACTRIFVVRPLKNHLVFLGVFPY